MKIDADTVKRLSAPYRGWHYYPHHVIPDKPNIAEFEDIEMVDVPTIFQLPNNPKWHMSFIGYNGQGYRSFTAESENLIHWSNMRLAMGFGQKGEFDFGGCVIGAYLYESYDIRSRRVLKRKDGKFWTLYGSYAKQGDYEVDPGYEGVATSEDGLAWQRAKETPILSVDDSDACEWEKGSIYQPWLVEHEGLHYNFYNAKKMPEWIEQMGLATSNNLFDWNRSSSNPIIQVTTNGYDERFVADGKVFRDNDHWVMFYFGVNCDGAHIMVAFSTDLVNWTTDPEPLYKAGGHPGDLDKEHAHKISLVWNPADETWYLFYCAVGTNGRGIGLITSRKI
uniref:Glycosyl hydrolase family 32 N-terminal domain-containing protein n=1 Tax=Ditylum brightwellii TaxID=49249 RepID=A0A6U3T2W8_9STRA|mmetsp:Transcript_35030/g.52262  ORF Transcript_35030/g.52262 Transcript_35030/m.52262 type:complete len:336 (+) Transcript_35030:179-1186(+)